MIKSMCCRWFPWKCQEKGISNTLNRIQTLNIQELRVHTCPTMDAPLLLLHFCISHWTDLQVWGPNCWPLFPVRTTGCCYLLLQKLPLWPAVIPDHKSQIPWTKWWWMRQQIHSIKQDIASAGFLCCSSYIRASELDSFHASSAVL